MGPSFFIFFLTFPLFTAVCLVLWDIHSLLLMGLLIGIKASLGIGGEEIIMMGMSFNEVDGVYV